MVLTKPAASSLRNLEAFDCTWPLPISVPLRALCVEILPLGISEGLPTVLWRGIMVPHKPFRSNTYEKPGGWGCYC